MAAVNLSILGLSITGVCWCTVLVVCIWKTMWSSRLDQQVVMHPAHLQDTLENRIVKVAKLIHNAKKHVRGSKTSDFLKAAVENMDLVLKMIGIEPNEVYKKKTNPPRNVCPEEYKGTTFGYPFFYTGFETTNCSYGQPVKKLVTVVKFFSLDWNVSETEAPKHFLSSVFKTHPEINVILSASNSEVLQDIVKKLSTVTLVYDDFKSEGEAINKMIRFVRTPYVLIARNIETFTNDSRLERLVREIESLDVVAAAGAVRDSDGHWRKGCYQSVYRNFTLKYLDGYDESLHECLFCDYASGPFVAPKEIFKTLTFSEVNNNEGLFEDWFLKLTTSNKQSIVCPDSMFNINITSKNALDWTEIDWTEIMKIWNLYKVVTTEGKTITRDCSDHRPLQVKPSYMLSPCDYHSNSRAVHIIMKCCETAGIVCELQEGSALGAVKFENTLPWERDIDLTFLTNNFTQFKSLIDKNLTAKGFRKSLEKGTWCCVDGTNAGGVFRLNYQGWNVELYGQHVMDYVLLKDKGITPTKILLDGKWVNAPRNPGLFARNRYGREIYQHAEHWLTTGGKSGWLDYKTNIFKPCSSPRAHDCLDRYNADGNLPFKEMSP